MRRFQLVEIHELPWCPRVLRDGLTDFLNISIDRGDYYRPARGPLFEAIAESRSTHVTDLCSGGGGAWSHWAAKQLSPVPVTLTDKFPNQDARERCAELGLRYYAQSVDATAVPKELSGFRTIFTAFHHFGPTMATAILQDAIRLRQPIAVCEFTHRSMLGVLFMLLSLPAVWIETPRMNPLGWRKLLFTYLIPLIPLLVTIDGIVSCLRTYTIEELKAMAGNNDYRWRAGYGRVKGWPLPVTFFIGYPPGA